MSSAPVSVAIESSEARWSESAIPFLCSVCAHLALMVVLGLCVAVSQVAVPTAGVRGDGGMRVTVATDSGGGIDDSENSSMSLPAGSGGRSSSDGASNSSGAAAGRAGGEGGGPLADVLREMPPIDLAGALPTVSNAPGAGALEGGGVANAQGLTKGVGTSKNQHGGYARTGVFGTVGEGHRFVYVFDRSGSMDGHGGTPLAAAKAELISSLQHLGKTHQFQIIFYNEHPQVFNLTGTPGRLVFGTDQNKILAEQFVNSVKADGATQHEEALVMALKMAPDVIFFLTDADEPRMSASQLAKMNRLNQGSTINAIEFGFGPQGDPENFLVQLARQNGGQHAYVDISELPAQR